MEINAIQIQIENLKNSIKYHQACIAIESSRLGQLLEIWRKENEIINKNEKYSTKDISILLNVSEETVRRWIRGYKLLATRDSKKEGFYIHYTDFEEFLNKHKKYYKMVHPET